MKKTILLILVFLFLAVGNSYCIEDKVVAIVNDEVITKAELDTYINLLKLRIGQEGWSKSGMTDKKVLENLIEERLVLQEAKNKQIGVEDRLVESRLQKMKSGFGSEDEFSQFLMQQGISLSELKENINKQMLSDKIITMEIRNRIFVSPTEVTKYYQDHLDDFYSPESVQLESIFVQDKKEANEIHSKLKSGADFTELQKQYSKRPNLGLVKKGEFLKNIEDVIFKLEIGKFSQPIEIGDGYYIFFLRDKNQPNKTDIVEVQNRIRDLIREMKFRAKLDEWIKELKDKSYIKIKDE